MRKTRRMAAFLTAAAVVAGVAAPAMAAAATTGREVAGPAPTVAFSPGSGQSVVDWNRELITILGTPGAQPAALQAASICAAASFTLIRPPGKARLSTCAKVSPHLPLM